MSHPQTVLITGNPGIGKTTFVIRLAKALAGTNPVGFYTKEIRTGRKRTGFELVDFDGRTAVLSHVNFTGPFRVGRYGVDIAGFDAFLSGLNIPDSGQAPIIIDEIGKMECYSPRFRRLVKGLLDSHHPFIATIALRGDAFIETIKTRDDISCYVLTHGNRDTLLPSVLSEIGQAYRI